MKMDRRSSIKDFHLEKFYRRQRSVNQWLNSANIQFCYASVWRELVASRAGDTSSRQTEADAAAFPIFAQGTSGREMTEGGPERY